MNIFVLQPSKVEVDKWCMSRSFRETTQWKVRKLTWRCTKFYGLGVLALTYFVDSCYTELVLLLFWQSFNRHFVVRHHLTSCCSTQQRASSSFVSTSMLHTSINISTEAPLMLLCNSLTVLCESNSFGCVLSCCRMSVVAYSWQIELRFIEFTQLNATLSHCIT